MKFHPLHDRVAVKRVAEETKSKGGIIIPDTAREKPAEGEIVPLIKWSRVDLPAPWRPTSPSTSPRLSEKVTSLRTGRRSKFFDRFFICSSCSSTTAF